MSDEDFHHNLKKVLKNPKLKGTIPGYMKVSPGMRTNQFEMATHHLTGLL